MTIEIMTEVPKLDLKPHQKHVLLCLADHASREQSIAWPSQGRIAWETGYTRKRVNEILRQLQDLGIIVEVEHPTKRLPCKTYELRLDKGSRQADFQTEYDKRQAAKRAKEGVTFSTKVVSQNVTPVVTKGNTGCNKMLHKPSIEPSIEPPSETVIIAESADPAPPTERERKDGVRKRLEEKFVELTAIPPPTGARQRSKETGTRWWASLRYIAETAGWDADLGERAMTTAVARMTKDGLDISAPQSIEKATISQIGQMRRKGDNGYGTAGNANWGHAQRLDTLAILEQRSAESKRRVDETFDGE